jgi:hypothetical protein
VGIVHKPFEEVGNVHATRHNDGVTDRHLDMQTKGKRPPAYALRALGRNGLPEMVEAGGVKYQLTQTVKHDFWAATGFYLDENGAKAVLKIGRLEPYAGVPLDWAGKFLCRRELRFYRALADVENVPAVLGEIGTTGFLHEYVEGRPLSRKDPVPDAFFSELMALMQQLHQRRIAYVDANKPENILLGDDGRPHLIDFQISWDLHELGDWWGNRWWLRRLQESDVYHVLKHKKRMRPDQTSDEERARVEKRGVLINLHRFLTKPYHKMRKAYFKRLKDSGRLLPEGSK